MIRIDLYSLYILIIGIPSLGFVHIILHLEDKNDFSKGTFVPNDTQIHTRILCKTMKFSVTDETRGSSIKQTFLREKKRYWYSHLFKEFEWTKQ